MSLYIWPPVSTSVTAPPIEIILDGIPTQVEEDTGNPADTVAVPTKVYFERNGDNQDVIEDTTLIANNRALPSKLFIMKDGNEVPVYKDTANTNTLPIPVEIVAASGTPINITAGDLNVQLTDLGVNFDATRIGDGSGNYLGVNASNEALVHDADVLSELVALNASDLATETTLSAILADTASLDAKDFATETTLSAILVDTSSLDAKDFATETTLAAILADTASLDTKDFATETTLAALSAKFNTLGQKANAAGAPVTLSTEQEALLQRIRDVLNTNDSGASTANTLRTVLATRHEAVGTPLSQRLSDGVDFISSIAIAAAQLTFGAITKAFHTVSINMGWDGTDHREISVDTSGNIQTKTQGFTPSHIQATNVGDGVAVTLTAPSGSKWVKLMASSENSVNLKVALGATATTGVTGVGHQLQPGRSEDFPCSGNVSVIAEAAATNQVIFATFGV